MRSPCVVTSGSGPRGSSRNRAQSAARASTSSRPALRARHVRTQASWSAIVPPRLVRRSPTNVRPSVGTARRSATSAARSRAKRVRAARVHRGTVRPGQPGLHRPRQRVAVPRLAQRDGLGHRHPQRADQPPGGRRLLLEGAPHRVRDPGLQREPRREVVAQPGDRVHGAGQRQQPDLAGGERGQLVGDERPYGLDVDLELPLVHRHVRRACRGTSPQLKRFPGARPPGTRRRTGRPGSRPGSRS